MDARDVETILLSSATEDYFGLYEAIWEINSRFPNVTLGRKYDAVANVLRFWNHQVNKELGIVLDTIYAALTGTP